MKSCIICGAAFTPRNSLQITCSPACSRRRALDTDNANKRRQYAERNVLISFVWGSAHVTLLNRLTGDKLAEWAIPENDLQLPILWHDIMEYITKHKLRTQEE